MTNSVANRILIPLLKSPAGRLLGRRVAVVEYDGRRSGAHHQLVTGYHGEPGGVRIRVGAAGQKTWWRNFVSPHPIRLRLAGHAYQGVAQVDREDEQVSIVVALPNGPVQAMR